MRGAPLSATHHEMAAQWHPTKNGGLTPDQISAGSTKVVWWMCSTGHEWDVSPNARKGRSSCPVCSGKRVSVGVNDLGTLRPDVAAQWHPTKNGDRGPGQVSEMSSKRVWWLCDACGHEWATSIANRTRNGSGCSKCLGRVLIVGVNDLGSQHPDVAAQWHPTKNGDLTPDQVMRATKHVAWWTCENGHEWDAPVSSRTVSGAGCAVCAGKRVIAGVNDLSTLRPDIAAQWHPTKNGDLSPERVSLMSSMEAWWLCAACGHEWRAVVSDRALGKGCRKCADKATAERNRVPRPGRSLEQVHPRSTKLWHPNRNGAMRPADVAATSGANVWWLCVSCDNEWESRISSLAAAGSFEGCASCSYAARGELRSTPAPGQSLVDVDPLLAAQWHPTRNGDDGPWGVSPWSGREAWWLCQDGHEWKSTVGNRSAGNGCPKCHAPSKPEVELLDIVTTLVAPLEVVGQQMVFGDRRRADVFVPALSVAVEFNGLYWHHDGRVSRDHHADRTALAAKQGVRLVHVWEDDWRDRRDVVIRGLAARLGVSSALPKVLADLDPKCWQTAGARTLELAEVDGSHSAAFMDANHIQGAVACTRWFALRDHDGDIRALLGLRSPRANARTKRAEGQWEITRYATRGTVPGGFSRLLRLAERNLLAEGVTLTQWVTFAAKDISEGGMYEATGFTVAGEQRPDYRYVGPRTRWRRTPKERFQRKRFREDPDLLWDESWTERQAAEANGLLRIWDSGKTKYIKDVRNKE